MNKNRKKFIAAAFVVVFLSLCIYYCYSKGLFTNLTVDGIKNTINSAGVFGPIVYMIMFSVIPSGSIIAIAGGIVFGVAKGALYTTLGAIIGATTAFYLSRLLGRDFAERITKGKISKFGKSQGKNGFIYILILRLIPVIPFNVVSFGAGLTKVKYSDYIFATMVGIIPGVLVFTNLGNKALDIKSPEFILAVLMLILLLGGSYIIRRKWSIEEIQNKFSRKSS